MNEKVLNACEKSAKELGISVETFMRSVYDELEERYDREDIMDFLDDLDIAYNDDDIDAIRKIYRDKYDCSIGTWDNISMALNRYKNGGK